MLLKQKRLPAVGLTVVATLLGCSSGGTGPGAEAFDAEVTTTNLATVEGMYETPQFQSLTVLGDRFGSAAAGAAVATAQFIAESTTPRGVTERAVALSDRLSIAFSSAASRSAPLIPDSWMGRVYVWDTEANGYVLDGTQTGPNNGIRFELYAVNPVTRQVIPDEPIGHADVLDEGTNNSSSIRLIVESDKVVYLNYAITATGVINAPVFEIEGFITDGVNRVDFNLSHALAVNFASRTLTIAYDLKAKPADFGVKLALEIVSENNSTTADVSILLTNGGDEILLEGSVVDDQGSIDVLGNGVKFATIVISESGVEAVNADGDPLTAEEISALREIWNVVENVLDVFDQLFRPAQWLFNFDG